MGHDTAIRIQILAEDMVALVMTSASATTAYIILGPSNESREKIAAKIYILQMERVGEEDTDAQLITFHFLGAPSWYLKIREGTDLTLRFHVEEESFISDPLPDEWLT